MMRHLAYRFEILKRKNTQYYIQVIVQSHQGFQYIETPIFAKLLNLSSDHPTFLNTFHSEQKENELKALGVFQTLKIKKLKSRGIWIKYTLKKPYAVCQNFSHTLMDEAGFLFSDFFFLKENLPKVIVSSESLPSYSNPWNQQLPYTLKSLIHLILDRLKGYDIECIDLSRVNHSSLGIREIVVTLKKQNIQLRLNPDILNEGIEKFYALYHESLYNISYPCIVDLRVEALVFWSYL